MVGKTISHYRIVEKLGEGGMGVVYKAIDTRLDRPVALKFLNADGLADPTRRQRFTQEARAASALNHPNITAVYDIDATAGEPFMAMEFISGKTLQQRIGRQGLPLPEAVRYLSQVAEGLSAAHAAGIVHRDLKPSNIIVGDRGLVKLVDFGLAKLTEPTSVVTAASTMTADAALTGRGAVLGTVEYMSPEQARGEPVDQRTDIWAFGCVLFQALTGRLAFGGTSVAETLARILESEPDWTALPPSTPPGLRKLIRACLRKDPQHRLRHIEPLLLDVSDEVPTPTPTPARTTRWMVPALAAALLIGAAAGWLVSRQTAVETPDARVWRLGMTFATIVQAGEWNRPLLAIAPDGSSLVYVGRTAADAERQLFLRRPELNDAEPLANTEGATSPFYSPDGTSVAFFAGNRLKKVSLVDRAVQTVTTGGLLQWGGAWTRDNTIVFSGQNFVNGLMRVPAAGGTPEPLTRLGPGEAAHRWPALSPSGRVVVYTTTITGGPGLEEPRLVAESFDTGKREVLPVDATWATFAPDGHLLFVQRGALLAAAFDADRLRLNDPPVSLGVESVIQSSTGAAHLGVSGPALVYLKGDSETRRLVWVDQHGAVEPIAEAPPRLYVHPRLSPDGTRIAVAVTEPRNDIWVFDLTRGSLSVLTLEGSNAYPIWAPDGRSIYYVSRREGQQPNVFRRSASGTGPEERLLTSANTQVTETFAPDGTLLFVELRPDTNWDILMLSPAGAGRANAFLATRFQETTPQISPSSGRWVAHGWNKTGSAELFLHSYPNPDVEVQVTTGGGSLAAWRWDERELYYRRGDAMMAVDVTAEPTLRVGRPRELFRGEFADIQGKNYDVTRNGERFLMVQTIEPIAPKDITVVISWMEDSKSRLQRR
jgi:Tol biopolymer transport system component/predicted Ser/Thr protein kinase